jgi:L-lactate dehydrogenase complex protein LldF
MALFLNDKNIININKNAKKALAGKTLQANLKKATAEAVFKRNQAAAISETFESSRDMAIAARDASIGRLEELIDKFAGKCAEHNIKCFIYDDYESANAKITELIKARGADFIVKSKSMLTEEIELNRHLILNGIEAVETDLGEFIVSLAGEKPSHLTAPALHKSRREVAALFAEKLGMPYSEEPADLSYFARRYLREKFMNARVGVTGANFAVADSGLIAVIENEANARLAINLPQTHIAVFGAEKIIQNLDELPHFLNLLSKSATGQLLNAYTSIIGPPAAGKERYFIIVTKERFKIAADTVFKEALRCIRCGACQNICPVFQRLSGHGYEFTYGGPIGTVLAPFFTGYQKCAELIDASTLCGFCKSICPMKINLPGLILQHRFRCGADNKINKPLFKHFKKLFSYFHSRIMSNNILSRAIQPFARLYFKMAAAAFGRNYIPLWSVFSKRDFIGMSPKTFMELYFSKNKNKPREKNGDKNEN